jgi:hypothetical protein
VPALSLRQSVSAKREFARACLRPSVRACAIAATCLLTLKSSAELSHFVRCLRCREVDNQPIQKRNDQVVEEFYHLRRVAYVTDQGSRATLGIGGAGSGQDRDILSLVRGRE